MEVFLVSFPYWNKKSIMAYVKINLTDLHLIHTNEYKKQSVLSAVRNNDLR